MTTKVCSKCKLEWPLSFYHKGAAKYGLKADCKACRARGDYYPGFNVPNKNKVKLCRCCKELKKTSKFQFFKNKSGGKYAWKCKECRAKHDKIYYEENKGKVKEYNAQRYINKKEHIKKNTQKWREANKDKINKAARKRGKGGIISLSDSYIVHNVLRSCFSETKPEIIEAKRNQLQEYRTLQKFKQLIQKEMST